jgi:hypothetical protein
VQAQSPSIWWRQLPDAVYLQGVAHLVDPGAHPVLAREREQLSCMTRPPSRPQSPLAVQALQVDTDLGATGEQTVRRVLVCTFSASDALVSARSFGGKLP